MESVRTVPLFGGLSDDDFDRLEREVEQIELDAGTRLFDEGDDGDRAYVITSGQIEVFKESTGKELRLAILDTGDVIGEMALLLGEPRNASVRAHTDVTLVAIHREGFQTLLDTSATAARAMFDVLITRLRDNTERLRKVERMAQLGTLTAGLAHELNNPAAAVKRGSGQLREAALDHAAAFTAVADAGLTHEQRHRIDELVESMRDRGGRPAALDAVARSDREAEVEDRLDDVGVGRAWELAPILVDAGLELADVEALGSDFDPAPLRLVLQLLAAEHALLGLLREVEEGATRLSAIVKALKSYSFLDQAPIQEIDVTAGLEDTLLILRSKTKDLEIVREFQPDLPKIEAFGSELNQVWTNLIDNAADAITSTGRADGAIVLRAYTEDETFIVEVEDNGTGIPDDIRDRVFDSFFTTKEPGKGTGLGLDISYGIVVGEHHGDIKIESHPGMTRFRVELPMRQSA